MRNTPNGTGPFLGGRIALYAGSDSDRNTDPDALHPPETRRIVQRRSFPSCDLNSHRARVVSWEYAVWLSPLVYFYTLSLV